MRFTYDEKTKLYELRNKMNSTVKRMDSVAVLFDSDTFKMIDYGSLPDMTAEHRKAASNLRYRTHMMRSDSWNLEYLNQIIEGQIDCRCFEGKEFATKFFEAYYRNPKWS